MNAAEYDRKLHSAIEDLEELAEENWDEKQSAAARIVLDDYDRTCKELSKAQCTIARLISALHAAGASDAVVAAVLAEQR